MQRRNFLGGLTAASLGLLLEDSLTEGAHAQNTAQGGTDVAGHAPFQDFSSRGFRKHDIRASLRKRAGNSDGARLPAHKPDVAIPRTHACRESHRDLRGLARLWRQRDTCLY